jgi:hypothetical protein
VWVPAWVRVGGIKLACKPRLRGDQLDGDTSELEADLPPETPSHATAARRPTEAAAMVRRRTTDLQITVWHP